MPQDGKLIRVEDLNTFLTIIGGPLPESQEYVERYCIRHAIALPLSRERFDPKRSRSCLSNDQANRETERVL